MYSDLANELQAAVLTRDVNALRDVLFRSKVTPGSRMSCRSKVLPTSQCDLGHALCQAAELGALDIVKELLKYRADLLYSEPWGRRPIHCAALGPSIEVLRAILRSGSPLSLQDETGASALHIAVERQNRKMVAFLVNEGATATKIKTYINGETPLHVACRIGDETIVRLILQRCANTNMKTLDKRTPLMYAIERHHISVVKTLCEFGVNLNLNNREGSTALHLAIEHLLPAVDILLQYGADPTITDAQGRTPLHITAFQRFNLDVHSQKAALFLQYGVHVDCTDTNGQTPLHAAAITGNMPVAQMLLNHGAHLNERDTLSGDTPLLLAVSHSKNDMLELLVEHGADVTLAETTGGMTPLHRILATRNPNKLQYMDYLIRHGAKINEVNGRGYAPLDCSVFHSALGGFDPECILRLVQAGTHLKQLSEPKRNILHKSPLCWLTWHESLPLARFLVECDWDLRHENWIRLRGRNQHMISFLSYVWSLVNEPKSLRQMSRTVIRQYMIVMSQDTDIVPLVNASPMPTLLKRYINLEMEIEACRVDIEAEKLNL